MGKKIKINYNTDHFSFFNSKTGQRYVYFSSLLNYPKKTDLYKLGAQAQDELKSINYSLLHKKDNNSNKGEGKIIQSLNFLKQAAEFERSKELKFFQNYNSKYSNVFDSFKFDSITDSNFDYKKFIIDINVALKGFNSFKNELEAEYDRINRMRETDDELAKNSKSTKNMTEQQKKEYEKQLDDIRSKGMTSGDKAYAASSDAFYLKREGEKTFSSLISSENTFSSEITTLIIKHYGSSLFMRKGNHIILDSTLVAVLLKVINDKVYAEFINKYKTIKNTSQRSINLKEVVCSPEIENYVNALINNKQLKDSLRSIADQHNINDDSINSINNIEKETEYLTNEIEKWYKKIQTPDMPDFKDWIKQHSELDIAKMAKAAKVAKSQAYYTGEDMSLMDFVTAGINGILGGGANATDDWEAGKLILSIDIDDDKLNNYLKERENKLVKLQEKYFNELQVTTDLASFYHNTKKLKELREEQNKLLKKVKSKLDQSEAAANYLLSHINIHGTVKGYMSGGRKSFEAHGGFEGAAFGSNLDNQLNIIISSTGEKILGSAGFSPQDKQLLKFAMINAGDQMIGGNNGKVKIKSTLENYFSIFLGFFMFNDAALTIQDISDFMKNQYTTMSEDIHVYQLNGLILPASYLLSETYNSLVPLMTDVEAKINTRYSTRAKLHTYNDSPKSNDWDEVSATAEQATYLEMKFLAGFFDILENLLKTIPS